MLNKDISHMVKIINGYVDVLPSPHLCRNLVFVALVDALGETSLACR